MEKKGKISFRTREGYGIFWSWTVFLISGVLSSIVWRYQSFAGALVDAFICSKFVLVLYCFCNLYDMKSVAEGVQKTLYRLTKGIVVILFTLTVINCMVPIFPKSDFRFFTYGIQLFFGHATFYAAASLTAVATIISGSEKKNGKDDIYMGLFCMFMSLRTKAVVAIAVLFLYVYIVKLKKRNVYLALIMAAIVVLAMGFDQISFYYGGNYLTDDNFVRERMLWDSVI